MILGIIEIICGLYLIIMGFYARSENPILLKAIPFLIGLFLALLGLNQLDIITLNI